MKRIPPLLALALTLVGAVVFSAGCANTQRTAPTNRPLTYALVATVNGSQAPTDAQWATLLKKFEEMLAARGVKLLVDPSLADKLIQVQFYPDADDPTLGTIYVVGISNNPGATLIAQTKPTRSSATYASASYQSSNLYPQYYGYFNDYNSDYGYNSSNHTGGSSTVTRPTTPPTHTTRPVICPPDSGHSSGGYAGSHPSDGNRHQRPYPESSGSYSSGSSSSGSSYSSSGSSSGSSYSSSNSGSSSYSSSSGSSSYSSGSSSYSSGSSSSYSAPSYSPPSYESAATPSGRDGGSQQQPR